MTIVQIESEEGVNNIEEIVSTKGVDAIMIGPADLTYDMGIPGQIHHPRVEAAFREIIHQCSKYGVAPGAHLNDIDDVKNWLQRVCVLLLTVMIQSFSKILPERR